MRQQETVLLPRDAVRKQLYLARTKSLEDAKVTDEQGTTCCLQRRRYRRHHHHHGARDEGTARLGAGSALALGTDFLKLCAELRVRGYLLE
jgi:hypothetical protein